MVLFRRHEGCWNALSAAARAGLIAFALLVSTEQAHAKAAKPSKRSESQERGTREAPLVVQTLPPPKTSEESRRDEREAYEKRNNDRNMVLWTRILAAVGFLQLLVFGYQSYVLRRTLSESRGAIAAAQRSAAAAEKAIEGGEAALAHAREAAVWQMRAYVAVERIDFVSITRVRQFQPVFRNAGMTPAKRASILFNYYLGPTPLAADFDFPDPDREPAHTMLAAGQERPFDGPTISLEDMESVRTGAAHYYVYGWIEYDDVFAHTPRRRTEFCSKLRIDVGSWALLNHSTFNGSDEDCYRQPQT